MIITCPKRKTKTIKYIQLLEVLLCVFIHIILFWKINFIDICMLKVFFLVIDGNFFL